MRTIIPGANKHTFLIAVLFAFGLIGCGAANAQFAWVSEATADGHAKNIAPTFNAGDGLYEIIEIDGLKAFSPNMGYLYFAVDDNFILKTVCDVTVEADYRDTGKGEFFVNYDAMTRGSRDSYRQSNHIVLTGDGKWKKAVFKMPSAYFGNVENGGADFRLYSDVQKMPISRVRIYLDGFRDKVYPSVEAMRQARREAKISTAIDNARDNIRVADNVIRMTNIVIAASPKASAGPLGKVIPRAEQLKKKLADKITASKLAGSDSDFDAFVSDMQKDIVSLQDCAYVARGQYSIMKAFEPLRGKSPRLLWFSRHITDSSDKVLPWFVPNKSNIARGVSIQACRGEYEPYSIELISNFPLKGVSVDVSDLRSSTGAKISAKNIDISIVNYWYQDGYASETRSGKQLVAELLLHDDSLIDTDLLNATTKCRFEDSPYDPERLKPFDLAPMQTRQLWLTVHAPKDAAAGIYRGKIKISCKGIKSSYVQVAVKVLPFDLADNPLISAMYFYEQPSMTNMPVDAYRKVLANMREHGLTNAGMQIIQESIGKVNIEACRAELALRREMGVNKGPLLTFHGYEVCSYLSADKSPDDVKLQRLTDSVNTMNALAKEYGYSGAYLYAHDEGAGEILASEVPVFKLLDKLGGGAWVAVLADFPSIALKDLQMPVYCGYPPAEVVDAVHKAGHKILTYGAPQGGVENPAKYRHGFGLKLWQLGVDGGCTFAYRCPFGKPWDDFDGGSPYRDIMMTYPGKRGPIDTIEWEGYREGCDDLRYLTTLQQALARAKKSNPDAKLVRQVSDWLDRLHAKSLEDSNLQSIREQMIEYILQLGRLTK